MHEMEGKMRGSLKFAVLALVLFSGHLNAQNSDNLKGDGSFSVCLQIRSNLDPNEIGKIQNAAIGILKSQNAVIKADISKHSTFIQFSAWVSDANQVESRFLFCQTRAAEIYDVGGNKLAHRNIWLSEPKFAVINGNDIKKTAKDMFEEDLPGLLSIVRSMDKNGIKAEEKESLFTASKNSKVFHLRGCSSAKRISKKNLVEYENREHALKAGKRPCKLCNP